MGCLGAGAVSRRSVIMQNECQRIAAKQASGDLTPNQIAALQRNEHAIKFMEKKIDGFEEVLRELLDDAFSAKKEKVGLSLLRFQRTLAGASRRSSTLCQYRLWGALVLESHLRLAQLGTKGQCVF